MRNLIFVGGIQYNGKSYFCKRLESIDKIKYSHMELDEASDYLAFHRDVFLGMIKRYDTRLYNQIEKVKDKKGNPQYLPKIR